MRNIEVTGHVGELTVKVSITDPHPKGGHWQIIIDNIYQGTIMKRNGEWIGHLNRNSSLQADDIQLLGAMIDREYPDE